MSIHIQAAMRIVCGFSVALTATAARSQTQFDGDYWGEFTLTRIIGQSCSRPAPGTVRRLSIRNSEVSYMYNREQNTVLTGRVDSAGAFTASGYLRSGLVQMVGRVQGLDLKANMQSPECLYSFQGKKQ